MSPMLHEQEHGAPPNNAQQDYVRLIVQFSVFSEDCYLPLAIDQRKKFPIAWLGSNHRFSAGFAIADLVHPVSD